MESPVTTKLIDLGRQQQLFPLNQRGLQLYHTSFHVESKSKTDFQAVVVEQKMLDEGATLEFKDSSHGKLSGSITHEEDSGEDETWYLILKSDKPNQVDLTIEINPLVHSAKQAPVSAEEDSTFDKYKLIIGAVILLMIGGAVYYYKYKRPSTKSSPVPEPYPYAASPQSTFVKPRRNLAPPPPPVKSPTTAEINRISETILEKMRNLPQV